MTEEIKNILESLQYNDYIGTNDKRKLREYITTLQEELEIMVKDDERSQEAIIKLSKENKRLKELCDKYEEEHSNEFQCWKRDRKELLDKRARIEKVVEYLKYQLDNLNTSDIDIKAKMLCAMTIMQLEGKDNE